MVVIRLVRAGSKHRPFYHIKVADQRQKIKGKFLEKLGYFNPIARKSEIRINVDTERVKYWLEKGAKMSNRISSLMKREVPKFNGKNYDELVQAKLMKKIVPSNYINIEKELKSKVSVKLQNEKTDINQLEHKGKSDKKDEDKKITSENQNNKKDEKVVSENQNNKKDEKVTKEAQDNKKDEKTIAETKDSSK